jgi:hypothetical protein
MKWWWGPLYTRTNTLSLICIVLAHWNNSPQVYMSPHSYTLSWFQANQSLLFLLNAVCKAEKQQIPILPSLVWPDQGSNNDLPHSIRAQTQRSTTLDQGSNTMIYHTWGKHANRYTNDAVVINRKLEAHMSMYHSSDKKDFMNHCRSQLMLNLIPNSWTQQTMGQLLVQNVISISQCSLVQNTFLCLILQMILLLIFPTAANIKLLGP